MQLTVHTIHSLSPYHSDIKFEKVKFRKVASFGTEWSKVYWIKNPNKVDFRLFNSLDYCAFFAHYVSPCSLFYALLANYYIYQYKVMIYHTNCEKNYLFHFWTSAFEKKSAKRRLIFFLISSKCKLCCLKIYLCSIWDADFYTYFLISSPMCLIYQNVFKKL